MISISSTDSSVLAALFSAAAAIASAVAAFLTLRESKWMREQQIDPSISVAFDNNVGLTTERKAVVENVGGCDITDLVLSVSVPANISRTAATVEATVMKQAASYDLHRRTWDHPFRRKWKPGAAAQVSCGSWFVAAREIVTLSALTPEEKAIRAMVVLDLSCRRVADPPPFRFLYSYRVELLDNRHLIALPVDGSNPADIGKQLILARKSNSDSSASDLGIDRE